MKHGPQEKHTPVMALLVSLLMGVQLVGELAGRSVTPILFHASLPHPSHPPKHQHQKQGWLSLGAPGVSVTRAICHKQHKTEGGSYAG